ncbi:MAG: zinc metalloprotease HtpX [Candidatus Altiarchaeota archaeon]|nr:zinc metalloprotease HtpX [Candidatus Altiarchaeota archaeon]
MSYITGMKTAGLMALLIAVLMGLCALIGGAEYVIFGLVMGVVMNFFVYWYSDKLVLRMTHAVPADPMQYGKLHEIVGRLSGKAGMPKPSVYVIEDSRPNAFATGRGPGHAAVAVHTGLLGRLTDLEVEGVLAHEITHIKNRDILISTVSAVIAGAISYITWILLWFGGGRSRSDYGLILAILAWIMAPIAAMLIQMAISRSREYSADLGGAKLSNPLRLAFALEKIDASVAVNPKREGNQALEQMYIINPFKGVRFESLFSTHPSTKDRVERLRGWGNKKKCIYTSFV